MKKFLIYIFLFVLLFIGIIFGLFQSTNNVVNRKATFYFNNNPKYLFIGHSHSECAYNDTIIKYSKNISQSGQAYFYNYIKLRKVLKENTSLETIFVEFTNNQINKRMDDWIWDDKYLIHHYSKLSPFMKKADDSIIYSNNKSGYGIALSSALRNQFMTVLAGDYDYFSKIGNYRYLIRNKTNSLLKNNNLNTSVISKNDMKISSINLNYLDSIIHLCNERQTNIVLVRTPMHIKSTNLYNESKYKNLIKNRYRNVDYIDLIKYPLLNEDFGDLEHLNHKGAKKLSFWFQNLLENGLLDKENKQDFINKNIPHK